MGGKMSRNKGSGYEREIVAAHRAENIAAVKVPFSGALKDFPGDVQIAGMIGECKRRKRGSGFFYKALSQGDDAADILFIRDDNEKTLVVIPIDFWFTLLKWAGIPKKFPAEAGSGDQRN
jgi:hypothetical protein|tara:strand:+ start:281 stop:640 length:360 start_codon:yes stop_codon:yes gene_type:complete